LYTLSGGGAATSEIKTASVEFSTGQVLSPPLVEVHEYVGANSAPRWSPDGRFLSWISRRQMPPARAESYLVIRSLDDRKTREVRLTAPLNPLMLTTLRWTPDSRALVGIGNSAAGRSTIYRIDAASGEAAVLATGGPDRSDEGLRLFSRGPMFSNDGRTMFFWRNATLQRGGILIGRDLASGQERELYTGPGGDRWRHSPLSGVLSADQQYLFYTPEVPAPAGTAGLSTVLQTRLVARHLAPGVERELIRGAALDSVSPSPDGRWLALSIQDSPSSPRAIRVVPAGGGESREVLRHSAPGRALGVLAWAPDSRSVIVSRWLEGGTRDYWWAPIDGREPSQLPELTGAISFLQVHPDGRRLVFVSSSGAPRTPDEIRVLDRLVAPAIGNPVN
jgi:Tol biopolymer transport system component